MCFISRRPLTYRVIIITEGTVWLYTAITLTTVYKYICKTMYSTTLDITCVNSPPPGWPEDSWLWLVSARSVLPTEHPLWYAWLPPPGDGGEQDSRWEGGPLGPGRALLWVPRWQSSLRGEECTAHICQNIKGGSYRTCAVWSVATVLVLVFLC